MSRPFRINHQMKRTYNPVIRTGICCLVVAWYLVYSSGRTQAQFSFEEAPINYGQTPATDRVAKLAEKLRSGKVRLDYDQQGDYLPAILQELEIPMSSQTLVFSKTSLQIHRISPATPRAIYFNDDVYVGWVQDGYMIEFIQKKA